jgi:hypothetical protein
MSDERRPRGPACAAFARAALAERGEIAMRTLFGVLHSCVATTGTRSNAPASWQPLPTPGDCGLPQIMRSFASASQRCSKAYRIGVSGTGCWLAPTRGRRLTLTERIAGMGSFR